MKEGSREAAAEDASEEEDEGDEEEKSGPLPDEVEALDLIRKASHVLSKSRGNIGDVAAEAQNRVGLYDEYYVARNDKGDVRSLVSQWCGFLGAAFKCI